MSEGPGNAKQPDAPDAKAELSRRDLFAKIGMALNGLAVVVLATPVVGYLLAPILRGEHGQYQRWVTLGDLDEFPEGQTRLAQFRNPISNKWDGDTDKIPCWVRRLQGRGVSGVRHQLRTPGLSGSLVRAVGTVHVPLSWRSLLPGWIACFRTASARPVPVFLQS